MIIYRLIEKKLVEPVLSYFRWVFRSEESYYRVVMSFRHRIRSIFGDSLTADEKHSIKRSEFYIEIIDHKSRVMDVGCGILGLGYHLINQLPKQAYFGVDILPSAIKEAEQKILNNLVLSAKSPQLFVTSSSAEIKSIASCNRVNTFVFNSVVTHMSLDLIENYLVTLHSLDIDNIKILGDINTPISKRSTNKRNVDYYHTITDFKTVAGRSGWNIDKVIEEKANLVFQPVLLVLIKK